MLVSLLSKRITLFVPLSAHTTLTELVFTLGYNLCWCVLTISLLLHPPAFIFICFCFSPMPGYMHLHRNHIKSLFGCFLYRTNVTFPSSP